MYVSASTACLPECSFNQAIDAFLDLEFSSVEIALHDDNPNQLTPASVADDVEQAIRICRDSHRMDIANYDVRIGVEGDEHYGRFIKVCELAKATKVVTLSVPSAPLGTPFNQEVEHLQRLVDIAADHGARVAMRSQVGCLTEDPDTVRVLCDNVGGLGLTLDPSHYLVGPYRSKPLDKLMKYVYHVHLRDSKKNQLQVRVGQGEIEYGRLVSQLGKAGYKQALSVDMRPMESLDMRHELRKLRLLLESLL
jgi:sugar phosphate isomerase/epimerase